MAAKTYKLSFSIANLLFMHYYFVYQGLYIGDMFAFSPIINFLFVCMDISVVFLLMLLITWGRISLSIHLCFFISLMWSFANVIYSRFFYQCLSLSAILQAGSVIDGIVLNSILGGFKLIDLFYILSPVLYFVSYKQSNTNKIRTNTISKNSFLLTLLIPCCLFCIALLTYTIYHFTSPKYRYHPELYLHQINENIINPFIWKNSMPVNVHFIAGSIRFFCSDIYDEYSVYELTEEQKEEINNEYMNHQLRRTMHPINDSIKNVTFILLESFLSATSDLYVNNKEITPFFNKLKRNKNVYYNGKIQPNITIGESGDGQLIYMSGLLPLKNRISVGIAKKRSLKGLPQLLKEKFNTHYTEIIIPSSPVIWEQRYMNERYGIDYMLSAIDIDGSSAFLIDEEKVFSLAESTGKELKQPFFSLVLGISTHQPYEKPIDNGFTLTDTSLPIQFRNYLIACHYVDKEVEKYFDYLHNKGIFNNSLIIIASDHHPHMDQLHMGNKLSNDLPLYIINSGINWEKAYHGKANQLDIYTTILDILSINNEWLGLGNTLLNPEYKNSVNQRTYKISEEIIMSDYFSSQ